MPITDLTVAQRTVDEFATWKYSATLKDEDEVVIPSASVTTLTVTLYDKVSGTIINGRNGTDILNANNGTLHATSGALTWTAKPNDNPIVNPSLDAGDMEEHILMIVWTYNAGLDTGRFQIPIYVRQVEKLQIYFPVVVPAVITLSTPEVTATAI